MYIIIYFFNIIYVYIYLGFFPKSIKPSCLTIFSKDLFTDYFRFLTTINLLALEGTLMAAVGTDSLTGAKKNCLPWTTGCASVDTAQVCCTSLHQTMLSPSLVVMFYGRVDGTSALFLVIFCLQKMVKNRCSLPTGEILSFPGRGVALGLAWVLVWDFHASPHSFTFQEGIRKRNLLTGSFILVTWI